MDLSNPVDAYLQMARNRNQNRQDMYQNIAGIGQGLGQSFGSIGDIIGEQKKKALLAQIVQAMQQKGQPIPGPQGYTPPGSGPNAVPAGQPSPGNPQQLNSLMMQYDPQLGMQNAYKQQQLQRKSMMAGQGKRIVYQNSDGSVSLNPTEGAIPLEVSDAQAMQYTAVPKSAKDKNAALSSRAEAWQRSIDVRQIDELVKQTGITPKQHAAIQQNSFRAARAVPILSKPNITYQELALGNIDLAGIMQGGVPQVDEIKATQFPGWQKQWGDLVTYASGHPSEVVPDAIRTKVLDLVKGTIAVDNEFIKANQKFAKSMIGPTIRGGITTPQNKAIDSMTGTLTLQGQNQGNTYSDPRKEARYQEYLRSKNASAQ